MGKWDFQAIEMLDGEEAIDAMRALYQAQCEVDGMKIDHQFRAYHTFRHKDKKFLHIGWNSCNALAYKVLKLISRNREITSTYSGADFPSYKGTLNAPKIFSADADKDFEIPITFDMLRIKDLRG